MIMRHLGQFIFIESVFLIANYIILYYKVQEKEHVNKKDFLLDLIPYYVIINGILKYCIKSFKSVKEYYNSLEE